MLKLVDISKQYADKHVFENVNCTLSDSLIYGLVGVNGAGKTTLLRMIARLLRKHEGRIFYEEKDITSVDAQDLPFSYVNDSPSFFPDLTVNEQMMFVCKNRGLKKQEAVTQMERYSNLLSLSEYASYYPRNLSRGTQQRLSIALSFFGKPKLCMYDEPFITLDPLQVENVETALVARKEEGIMQIVSSHNLDSLERICDRYLIIHGKKIDIFSRDDLDREKVMGYLNESVTCIL